MPSVRRFICLLEFVPARHGLCVCEGPTRGPALASPPPTVRCHVWITATVSPNRGSIFLIDPPSFGSWTTRMPLGRSRREAARRPVGPVDIPACAGLCFHLIRAPSPRCINWSVCAMTLTRCSDFVSTTHRPSWRAVVSVPRKRRPSFLGSRDRTASSALSPCGGRSRWVRTMRLCASRRGKPEAFLGTTNRRPRPLEVMRTGRPVGMFANTVGNGNRCSHCLERPGLSTRSMPR